MQAQAGLTQIDANPGLAVITSPYPNAFQQAAFAQQSASLRTHRLPVGFPHAGSVPYAPAWTSSSAEYGHPASERGANRNAI